MEKKSFILHLDSLDILEKMDDTQRGKFIYAIYQYQKTGALPQLDFGMDMAVTPFINQFKRDGQKYESIIERNKSNGSKGGRPKNSNEPKETQITQWVFEKPKKADNDNDSVNDNENENDFKKRELIQRVRLNNQVFFELKAADQWLEIVGMQFHRNKEDVLQHLGRFFHEIVSKEDYKTNTKDAKNHFINWIKKDNPITKYYPKSTRENNVWGTHHE
jgi:hypothetical protein